MTNLGTDTERDVKLKLHVFADGRCVLSTESPLTTTMVEQLKFAWREWVTSGEAHPILIFSGVVEIYDVVFRDNELHIVEGE
jgi:hypothetical protein